MAKFLSDRSAQRLGPALDAIESLAPRKRNAPRRRIRSLGGAERPFVEITGVYSPSNYLANVVDPLDDSVTEEGVDVIVKGAISNEFQVGYQAFADKVGDLYYLDGYLLG